MSGEEAFKIYA